MMLMLQCILLSCIFGFITGEKDNWTYKDAAKWKVNYTLCGGTKQSPINIEKSKTKHDSSLGEKLTFLKYDSSGAGKELVIQNNGYTLNVNPSSLDASIKIKEIGDYKLVLVHFHWGSVDSKGSEHRIDNKAYPAELHLIHYNKKYKSFNEARNNSDGIVVVGVLIEKGAEHEGFNQFLNLSKYNVIAKGANVSVKAFKMSDFLPKNKALFYWYKGSFTSPTCDQTVQWIVYDRAIQISENQLEEFRKLKGKGDIDLVNNFRPLQKLNDRMVLASLDLSSSGCSLKVSFFIVFLFVISSFIFL